MRPIARRLALAALLMAVAPFFATASAAQSATSDAGSGGVRRALLIGINEYMALPDLRGALNDLELLKPVLIKRFGFREEHIRVVTNAAATRAGILAALETLVAESGPRDFVYIHYSGHGSQVPDRNADEQDDVLDETLVPHDGRTAAVPDILDDELALILSRFQTERVVVALDSCHSGTATRDGASLQARQVPPDDRLDLYDAPSVRTRALVSLAEGRYVLFTAAAPHQKALDGPVDGRPHGLFSFALARGFAAAGPEGSPRQILAETENELGRIKAQLGLSNMPEPQLEGPVARIEHPIFAPPTTALVAQPGDRTGADVARLPWVAVAPTTKPGFVVLRNAVALGGGAGSAWGIYASGETQFLPGRALAEAEVVDVKQSDSLARITPTEAFIPQGARAIALMPARPTSRIPIRWIDVDFERGMRRQQALASRMPDVGFVPSGEFARFIVECRAAFCRVFGADGVSELATVDAGDEQRFASEMARILGRSLTATELLALHNPATTLRLDLNVAGTSSSGTTRAPTRSPLRAPRYWIRRPGEPRTERNSLQIQVTPSHDCYLTLVDLDPEGRIQILFPNPISEQRGFLPDGRLSAGRTVLIPDSLDADNRAGFHIDYAPPAGIETIRGFCSTDLSTGKLLRSYVQAIDSRAAGGASHAAAEYRSIAADELGGLRTDLSRLALRGLALVPAEGSSPMQSPSSPTQIGGADWTAGSLTIQVSDASVEGVESVDARGQEIGYLDSDTFDSRLASALRGGTPTVTVRFVVPVPLDQIPERVDRWLSAVGERYGGIVELEPDPNFPATRDIVGIGISIVTRVYQAVQKKLLYRPAGAYDATLYYHPGENAITRIEFRHK